MKKRDGDILWECPKCKTRQWQPPSITVVYHNCSGVIKEFKKCESDQQGRGS